MHRNPAIPLRNGSLHSVVSSTPTRFARELEMATLSVWAELSEEADTAGRLICPSDDHHSKDRIERP